MKGSYLVAYRLVEMACRELEKINTPMSQQAYEKTKDAKRELEDILY